MANSRKKISELPPLNVASLDTTFVLGISGSTTYKISINNLTSSLDGTFATDLVTAALSSSLDGKLSTSSFQSFSSSVHTQIVAATNEQSFNGLISGSSQLTSSYDNRYVLSGSITQTTWDNIANKPSGIVSQSVDIADFTFTSETITNGAITLHATDSDIVLNADGDVYIGSANSGNGIVTDGYLENIIGDTTIINTGTGNSITDNLNNIINNRGIVSSSTQISDLGFVTGSYAYLTEFNSLTQSFNIISGSVVNITNAVDVTQLNNTTASLNSFSQSTNTRLSNLESHTSSYLTSLSGAISSSSQLSGTTIQNLSGSFTGSFRGNIAGTATYSDTTKLLNSNTNQDYSIVFTTSGSNGYLTQYTDGLSNFLYNPSTNRLKVDYIQGAIEANNGVISGSSQLTSSYDSRYVLSGSISAVPAGTISGSAQITTLGFISSSTSVNTSSLATTGSNTFIGTETISGSLLLSGSFSYNGTPLQNGFAFAQPILTKILDNVSYTGASAWSASYTSSGGAIIVRADATAFKSTGGLGTATLYRDGASVATQTFYFNQANVHTSLPAITYVRNSETGSHTYSIGVTNMALDTQDYATITVLEYGNSAMFPTTIISGSAQITSLGFVSGSYETTGRGIISSSANLVTTSSFNSYTASISTASLVTSISNLNAATSSYLTSLSGAISSSSQLTSSYDTRYTLSGSISATPVGTISGSSQLTSSFDSRYVLESETGSLQTSITNLNSFSASENTKASTLASYTASVNTTTSSLNAFTTSINSWTSSFSSSLTSSITSVSGTFSELTLNGSRINANGTISKNFIKYTRTSQQTSLSNGSVVICNVLENSSGNIISPNTSTGQITLSAGKTYRLKGMVPGFTTSGGNVRPQFCWYNETTSAYIGSSAQGYTPGDAANYGAFGGAAEAIITTNATTIVSFRLLGGATGLSAIGGNGDFSTTGSYPWIDIEEVNSSFALNTISGGINYTQVLGNQRNGISSAGTSIVSGSITTTGKPVQITVSGDANPTSGTGQWCSLQIYRDGSAIGNGIQLEAANQNENQGYSLNIIDTPAAGTYTYSLRVPTITGTFQFGEVAGPVLIIKELGSLTVITDTNNTFTGTNTFSGSTIIKGGLSVNNAAGSGGSSEGGEIDLQYASTTTLTGSFVALDVYNDRLRIFEGGGNNRGVYLDLSKTPTGVAGELMWKASGIVNAGTFVTLDNIKATVTTTGSRGLSVATVAGTVAGYISGQYQVISGGSNGGASTTSLSTTATSSMFGWNFTGQGDTATFILRDDTNNRVYRIIMIIGGSYNNNFISIERLY